MKNLYSVSARVAATTIIDHLWNNDIKHEYSMHMSDTINEPEHYSDTEIFEIG